MDKEDPENDKALKLLQGIVKAGHGSVLEHCCFTFSIEGISRACSHQLVRHRIASYSQQSQRYVKGDKFDYVIPPEIEKREDLKKVFDEHMRNTKTLYNTLILCGMKKEDARYLLPNATTTNIVVTMNARELLHFIELRTSPRAQWEIRELAGEMLKQLKEVAPVIFSNINVKED
jgi:thymidylate synthase (FAD)